MKMTRVERLAHAEEVKEVVGTELVNKLLKEPYWKILDFKIKKNYTLYIMGKVIVR